MLYHTWSYEEMKQQLEERRVAHEHELLCASVAEGHRSTFHFVAEHLGTQMVRIGVWLENMGRAGALVSDTSSSGTGQ